MHIGKCKPGCPSLNVHERQMERVPSDTYLGDIVSDDGKNKLKIVARVAKGMGITSPELLKDQLCLGSQFLFKNVRKPNSSSIPCFHSN